MSYKVIAVDLDRLDELAAEVEEGYWATVAVARKASGDTLPIKFMSTATPSVVRFLVARIKDLEAQAALLQPPF